MSNEMEMEKEIDFKITKRHFPRINNDSVLEFVFEKDPNLFMRKNKIIIRGAIEVDRNELKRLKFIFEFHRLTRLSGYIIENGFVSKLFSMMNVDIDSQTVSKSTNRYKN